MLELDLVTDKYDEATTLKIFDHLVSRYFSNGNLVIMVFSKFTDECKMVASD